MLAEIETEFWFSASSSLLVLQVLWPVGWWRAMPNCHSSAFRDV